jgi:50S ribosome-binding GTPase
MRRPELAKRVQVGHQGDIFVIGAQNAGKSSLLNALRWQAGSAERTAPLTTAALPGTTLALLQVDGLPLLGKSRCYDTPGVPHHHQLTSRLSGPLRLLPVRCAHSALRTAHVSYTPRCGHSVSLAWTHLRQQERAVIVGLQALLSSCSWLEM